MDHRTLETGRRVIVKQKKLGDLPALETEIDGINEEAGEFTRDMRILPSSKAIKDLIIEDARDIADEIKDKLIAQAKGRRGYAETNHTISITHKEFVVKDLRKWAKLFGYKLEVDGDYISVKSNGVNRKDKDEEKTKLCSFCKNTVKPWRRAAKFATGFVPLWALSIATPLVFGCPTALLGTLSFAFIASIVLFGYAIDWE